MPSREKYVISHDIIVWPTWVAYTTVVAVSAGHLIVLVEVTLSTYHRDQQHASI